MIDQATLMTYVAIVLGFVFIPGPATLLTVARATTSGTRVGIATGAGITTGDILHTFLVVVGISAIIAISAVLFSIIKYLGAAYLIYLGIKAIMEKAPTSLGCKGQAPITAVCAFRQAILAEVLNRKTALFFLAFLPQFVNPENGSVVTQLIILGVLFAFIGFFSTIVFAVSAGGSGPLSAAQPQGFEMAGQTGQSCWGHLLRARAARRDAAAIGAAGASLLVMCQTVRACDR